MNDELLTALGVFFILAVMVFSFWKWRKSKASRKANKGNLPPVNEDDARGI